MKVLIAASEMFPFAKTGGLGDTIYFLTKYLCENNISVTVVIPLYGKKRLTDEIKKTDISFDVDLGAAGLKNCEVYEYQCKHPQCKVYFVYNEYYFERDEIYTINGKGYPDNDERYIFLVKATIELIKTLNEKFDVIHSHEWHTALLPAIIKINYSEHPLFKDTKHLFTIHNLAYQGLFSADVMNKIGIGWEHFHSGELEFWGHVNFMKAGLVFADKINTISERYLEMIKLPEYGYGLEGVINFRESDIVAINNGIDEEIWNPETDKFLYHNYGIDDFEDKKLNKHALQKELDLEIEDKPIFCIISRLTEQKGIDLIASYLENFYHDIQLIILGKGEMHYENKFLKFQHIYNNKLRVFTEFNEELAHKLEGSCDYIIIPPKFDAAASNQLYSMKYGTIPVISTGSGLSSLIIDIDEDKEKANGIKFNYSLDELIVAIDKAINLYKDEDFYNKVAINCMKTDLSWEKTIKHYIELYKSLINKGE